MFRLDPLTIEAKIGSFTEYVDFRMSIRTFAEDTDFGISIGASLPVSVGELHASTSVKLAKSNAFMVPHI
jgi:hypothetical protein